jgi:hypothetical protein
MASRGSPFVNRLPIIGQHNREKATNHVQNEIFAADAPDNYIDPEPTVREWLKASAPTGPGVLKYLMETFPFTKWIFAYNLTWLVGDLIAGKGKSLYSAVLKR